MMTNAQATTAPTRLHSLALAFALAWLGCSGGAGSGPTPTPLPAPPADSTADSTTDSTTDSTADSTAGPTAGHKSTGSTSATERTPGLAGTQPGAGLPVGKRPSGAAGTPKNARASSSGAAKTPAGTQPAAAPRGPSGQVSKVQCEAWIDHFLAISQNRHNQNLDPDYRPTPEQMGEIRSRLGPQLMQACMQLDKTTYACEMKAADTQALVACSARSAKP